MIGTPTLRRARERGPSPYLNAAGAWALGVGLLAACGGGGSSSGDSTPSITYYCNGLSNSCDCYGTTKSPPPQSTAKDCSPSSFPDAVCCASRGWPNTSSSCTCSEPEQVNCGRAANGRCDCLSGSLVSDLTAVDSCQPAAGEVCCVSFNLCRCSKGTSCAGQTEVPSCGSTLPVVCTDRTQVASCNVDSGSVGSGGSRGSGGSGSSGVCPEKAYKTCSSGADCACTGTCARLNTTDSTKYCTRECTTDGDCANTWKDTGLSCNNQTFTCTP